MKTNAMLVIVHPELDGEIVEVLGRAMQRRGWRPTSSHSFRSEFDSHHADHQIVKRAERDLRQAEYVAGVRGLEAVCLVGDLDEPSLSQRQRSRS
jgi:hypothetical protein